MHIYPKYLDNKMDSSSFQDIIMCTQIKAKSGFVLIVLTCDLWEKLDISDARGFTFSSMKYLQIRIIFKITNNRK